MESSNGELAYGTFVLLSLPFTSRRRHERMLHNIVLDRRAVVPFCAVSDLWLLVEEELVERAFMAWQLLCSAVGRSRLSRAARTVLRLATGPTDRSHFGRPGKLSPVITDHPSAIGIRRPRTSPERVPLD